MTMRVHMPLRATLSAVGTLELTLALGWLDEPHSVAGTVNSVDRTLNYP